MALAIDQLILMPRGARTLLRDEIFEPVVAPLLHPPFPCEIEIIELVRGDDVASAHLRDLFENAILHFPAAARLHLLAVKPPTAQVLAIEEHNGTALSRRRKKPASQ